MTSTRVTTTQRLLALLLVAVPGLIALDTAASPTWVVAAIMLAALAILALHVATAAQPAALTATGHAAARAPRGPTRQCDPDAAGHVRPRAPGSRTRAV